MNRTITISLILIGALVLVSVWTIGEGRTRAQSVTPSSRSATGLSVFDAMGVALGHGPLIQQKQPILSLDTIGPADLFLSLSPRSAYSEREAGILNQFLQAGGTVIVSFHDDTSSRHIGNLLSEFGLPLPIRDDPAFSNRQSIEVVADRSIGPIADDMRVHFYSRQVLDLTECRKGGVSCYAARWMVGKGQLFVFAGYPPFVNGLITRGENPELAARIRTRGERIVVDDYRNFFSDRTMGDLFMEPSFAVPVFGVVVAVLAFLLFGRLSFEDIEHHEPEGESHGSLHLFQEQVLKGLLSSVDRRSRIEQQLVYLERLFPEGGAEIEKILSSLTSGQPKTAAHVCHLHREFLRRRGLNVPQLPNRSSI